MAKETYRARVAAHRQRTSRIYETTLELVEPPEFRFRAGQFVTVPVAEGALRSYSIASPPTDPRHVLLVVEVVPGGPGSEFFRRLCAGDAVSFQGPYGAFHLREDTGRKLILVATGTGIAPIRGMLCDLRDRGELERPVQLFYGCRHREDLIFHEQLGELAERHRQLAYYPTLSQPRGDGWAGLVGRVTAHLPHYVTRVEGKSAFLCGSSSMLKDVSDILVGLGMDRRKIKKEQFY